MVGDLHSNGFIFVADLNTFIVRKTDTFRNFLFLEF